MNDTLVIYSLGNFISNQLSIGLNQGIGLIVGINIYIEDDKIVEPLKKVLRLASTRDLKHAEECRKKEKEAFELCNKKIKEHKLEDRVKLLGFLNQEQVKDYISRASFVVVPSIWYENCPYSILETLSMGKCVVGSKIGGIPELIKNNKNGFLYKYDDIDALTKIINKLFKDKKLRVELGKNARLVAEENYNIEGYYNKLEKIYQKYGYEHYIAVRDYHIPQIYLENFPSDFNQITDFKRRNELFIRILTPLALKINQEIMQERSELLRLQQKYHNHKNSYNLNNISE